MSRASVRDVDEVLFDLLKRIDAGEPVDREEVLERHPEFEVELAEFFDAEDMVTRMAGPVVQTNNARAADTVTADANLGTADTRTNAGPDSRSENRPNDAEPAPEMFGRYRLVKTLGEGAMGSVYLAEDTMLMREVALKLPKFGDDQPELQERFLVEARAAANLRHTNICPVFDVGEEEGRSFITMAYIPGRPLSDYAKTRSRQKVRQVVKVVRKLALALQVAHEAGVVHRDVKPANVMIDDQGEPVVMDFGLARHTTHEEGVRLTRSGAVMGTPAYMSPEQVEGRIDDVGPASDQFSLGAVLYEMLTGELPFPGASMGVVMAKIMQDEPAPPSSLRKKIDPLLDEITLRMMAKPIGERYASMKEVAEALTGWLQQDKDRAVAGGADPRETAPFVHPSESAAPEATSEEKVTEPAVEPGALVSAPDLEPPPVAIRVEPEPAMGRVRPRGKRSKRVAGTFSSRRPPVPPWAWIAGGVGGAALLVFGLVFLLSTPEGTLRVEVEDGADIEVLVDGTEINLTDSTWQKDVDAKKHRLAFWIGGVEVPFDEKSKSFVAENGKVSVSLGNATLTAQTFNVSRRGTTVLRIGFVPNDSDEGDSGPPDETTIKAAPRLAQRFDDRDTAYRRNYAVAFSPDGGLVDSAHEDGEWRKANPTTGAELPLPVEKWRFVAAVAWSPDGSKMVVGSSAKENTNSRSVQVWDTKTETWSKKFEFESGMIRDVAVSDDGTRVVVSAHNSPVGREMQYVVKSWSLATNAATGEFSVPYTGSNLHSRVISADLSRDAKFVAVAQGSGIDLWDVESETKRRFVAPGHIATATVVRISRDGDLLAWGTGRGGVYVADVDSGATLATFDIGNEGRGVVGIGISHDGNLVAAADGRKATVWNRSEKTSRTWRLPKRDKDALVGYPYDFLPRHVVFSPDGRYLATAGSNTPLCVWDLSRDAEPAERDGSPRPNEWVFPAQLTTLATGQWQPLATKPEDLVLETNHGATLKDRAVELVAPEGRVDGRVVFEKVRGKRIIVRADVERLVGHTAGLAFEGKRRDYNIHGAKNRNEFTLGYRVQEVKQESRTFEPPAPKTTSGSHDLALAVIDGHAAMYLDGKLVMHRDDCEDWAWTPMLSNFNWEDKEPAKAVYRNLRVMVLDGLPPVGGQGEEWTNLFNGRDLDGLEIEGHRGWSVRDGHLVSDGGGRGWIGSTEDYDDFEFSAEYRLPTTGNSGVMLRIRPGESSALDNDAVEIQLIDDARVRGGLPETLTGAVYKVAPRSKIPDTTPNQWHTVHVKLVGRHVTVVHDGETVLDTDLPEGAIRDRGRVGLQAYASPAEFRNVRVRRLGTTPAAPNETPNSDHAFLRHLVWVKAPGDDREHLAVATDLGLCTVYPGGAKQYDVSSLDRTETGTGAVGTRSPFPFCWIDPETWPKNLAKRAADGAHRRDQAGFLVMKWNDELVVRTGRVGDNGTFAPDVPYRPRNRGVAAPGPVFNEAGEFLGYGVRLREGQAIKIYPAKRDGAPPARPAAAVE